MRENSGLESRFSNSYSQYFFSPIVPFIGTNSSKKSRAPTNFPCTMSVLARYPFYYPLSQMIFFLNSSLECIVATIKDELCFYYQCVCLTSVINTVFSQLLSFFILVNKDLTNCQAKSIHFKTIEIYLSIRQPRKYKD